MRPHYLQSSWPWTSCDQAGPPQQRPPGGRPMSKKDTEVHPSLEWLIDTALTNEMEVKICWRVFEKFAFIIKEDIHLSFCGHRPDCWRFSNYLGQN
ncbi:PREDICTED: uncharacterized protein LOC108518251 isoform X2 [Rhinopithecus bieti]|uniref:uncharacterized protein LOC108518251 isoform X2 n=1 Tax=Rhinopithecus bieti TaxID=61621 RepID=UPI00083C3D73|nr:PREDICTED: uncharacterized protein LOC108518251 isoform X2 [Rhinopithecus bieti]